MIYAYRNYHSRNDDFVLNKENLISKGFNKWDNYPLGWIYTNIRYIPVGVCVFEIGENEWMVEQTEPQGNGKRVKTINEAINHLKEF